MRNYELNASKTATNKLSHPYRRIGITPNARQKMFGKLSKDCGKNKMNKKDCGFGIPNIASEATFIDSYESSDDSK